MSTPPFDRENKDFPPLPPGMPGSVSQPQGSAGRSLESGQQFLEPILAPQLEQSVQQHVEATSGQYPQLSQPPAHAGNQDPQLAQPSFHFGTDKVDKGLFGFWWGGGGFLGLLVWCFGGVVSGCV